MVELSDEQIASLSFPAQAVYSELMRTGEIMRHEEFSQEFPESYSAILKELRDAGWEPESIPAETPRGVLFQPGNRSARYVLRVD
jgi:hypothetical protein